MRYQKYHCSITEIAMSTHLSYQSETSPLLTRIQNLFFKCCAYISKHKNQDALGDTAVWKMWEFFRIF